MPTKHNPVKKILIANRGEIARRIIRTCKSLGIATVAVYSDADKFSSFVSEADEAIYIGKSEPTNSYLNIEKIIFCAKKLGVDAIHPGYGFLSENSTFARKCRENGIRFIGPTPESMEILGNKKQAKIELSRKEPSIPLIPGHACEDQSVDALIREADKIGYPIVLKAAAGGGGRGMRVVHKREEMASAIDSAKIEAKNSFGDDHLLIEKYFTSVRHVEFQILGDKYGNVIHLYERECSVQRRHQKVIEETPSVIMTPQLREKMGAAAETIGKLISYVGAGTVEFIVDENLNFYFLEVNTRLQVEHPVTEFLLGIDLVELQILVEEGYSLSELQLPQKLKPRGHAIEVRLYAEDPLNNFYPSPGKILAWKPFEMDGVRYDTGVESGSEISVFYDPLICKVITFAKTRDVAIEKMKMALKNSILLGPQTNRNFLVQVLSHPDFCSGKFDTNFIALNFPEKVLKQFDFEKVQNLATIALLWDWLQRREKRTTLRHITPGWRNNRYKNQEVTFMFKRDKSKKLTIGYQYMSAEGEKIPKFKIQVENKILMLQLLKWNKEDGYVTLECSTNGVRNKYFVAQNENEFHVQSFNTGEFVFIKKSPLDVISESESVQTSGTIVAGLPGNVFKVLVNNGDMVKKGEPIIVLESMKMEHKMFAEKDGIVEILVKQGQLVKPDQLLARIK